MSCLSVDALIQDAPSAVFRFCGECYTLMSCTATLSHVFIGISNMLIIVRTFFVNRHRLVQETTGTSLIVVHPVAAAAAAAFVK